MISLQVSLDFMEGLRKSGSLTESEVLELDGHINENVKIHDTNVEIKSLRQSFQSKCLNKYNAFDEAFLVEHNSNRELAQSCVLIFAYILNLEQLREVVLAEFLGLMQASAHSVRITTAYMSPNDNLKEEFEVFIEHMKNDKTAMCAMHVYDRKIWSEDGQRIGSIKYMHHVLDKKTNGKVDFENYIKNIDCNLPLSGRTYQQWLAPRHPKKAHRIEIFQNWGPLFSISFKFKPKAVQDGSIGHWLNIFHMTTGADSSRLPAIFLRKDCIPDCNWSKRKIRYVYGL